MPYIYFTYCHDTQELKIGRANNLKNVEKRIDVRLRHGNGKVEVLEKIHVKQHKGYESKLHKMFEDYKIPHKSEMFKISLNELYKILGQKGNCERMQLTELDLKAVIGVHEYGQETLRKVDNAIIKLIKLFDDDK